MKHLLTLLTFLIGFGAVGWSQSGAASVYQIIQNSSDHTTLDAALQASGLDAALSGPGTFTVFAPTNEAFDALPPEDLQALLDNPEDLLTHILLYHVAGDELQAVDLSDGQMIPMLNGQDVTVDLDGGVFINTAQVTQPNLNADNGVVHVVNALLVPEISTVWDIIEGSDDHNTLEAGINAAGLVGALDGFATNTVFAPTDAAFDALPAGVLDALLANPSGLLTDILLYHVTEGAVLSGDLSDGQMVTTLNGQDVTVSLDGGVFINGAEVTLANLEADNGVVHVIDAVLVPSFSTVWDIIEGSDDHNTLEAGINAAGLVGALDGFATNTVFAPTDAAFDALPAGVLDALLANPSGLLTDILLYHVTEGAVLSGDLSDGQMVTTLNGQDVTVSLDGGVFINGAEVTLANLEADNGVVHVIDAVLVPSFSTVWDIIEGSDDHNTLEAGINAAGLVGALDGFATNTVFAPTDAAFDALPAGVLDALLANPSGLLTDILLYHVTEGAVLSGDLSDGQMVTTLNGQDVTVSLDGGVFINGAEVTLANLEADNGVVHVIDAVLVPSFSTVWDIIEGSDDHNTLEAGINAAGLVGALDGFATNTVFAPTDAAFDALPAGVLDALLANPSGLLTDILLYHVTEGAVLSGDLSDGQMVTTLNGQDVTVSLDGGVFINGAEVTLANLEADNGVVHVIDAVLVPSFSTVWDIIEGSDDHNTLEAGINAAGLVGALDGFATNTVFAPTDAAFDALPAGVLDALLANPSGLLTDILLYHVTEGAVLSGDLSDGQMVTTLNGQDVTVSLDGGVFINGAEVTLANLEADNGVVHVIDAVLVPEFSTVWEIIEGSPDHNTLETAILAAGLEGALDGFATNTVFAPTDAAFAALPDGVLDALLDDPTGLLTDYLTYHVVQGEALSSSLMDGQMITTLNGADVTVSLNGGVFINDAEVIDPDLQADNGVVHVIDKVLDPNTVSVNEIDLVNVNLFPNPSSGMVNVTLTDLPAVTGFQVVSASGAVVANGVLQPGYNTVDLSNLSKGLYLFQVFDDNGSKVERLVIQ